MELRLPNSPTKLALLSVLSCLFASLLFIVPQPPRHSGVFDAYLLLGFAALVAGAILSLKFATDLRHGVENQDWPESQIEPLRKHLESPWSTALSIALFIAFICFEFVTRRFRGDAWACYLFVQTISQLRIAVRRRKPSEPSGPFTAWRDYLHPIHSDHWGSR